MTDTPHDSLFRNQVILAPMMVGSNRTFRRIAHRFGADILGGEMAHSSKLRKGDRKELALISARYEEGKFSAQICGCNIEQLTEAAKVVEGRGASVLDVNAGCPMHFVTSRGSGAALLESRSRLARIVEALKNNIALPVTVKIRAGFSSKKASRITALVQALENAGVDAVTIHARFRDQFYETPADWSHIKEAVEAVKIPIIGNGDIRTYEEALRMREETGCASVMIGRAALQRPWIFSEIKQAKALHLTPAERWAIFDEQRQMIQEAFGQRAGFELMRWHAGWYCRWHAEQKTFRERWSEMDETSWDVLMEEVKRITLAGPEILPTPILKHDREEAG